MNKEKFDPRSVIYIMVAVGLTYLGDNTLPIVIYLTIIAAANDIKVIGRSNSNEHNSLQ